MVYQSMFDCRCVRTMVAVSLAVVVTVLLREASNHSVRAVYGYLYLFSNRFYRCLGIVVTRVILSSDIGCAVRCGPAGKSLPDLWGNITICSWRTCACTKG